MPVRTVFNSVRTIRKLDLAAHILVSAKHMSLLEDIFVSELDITMTVMSTPMLVLAISTRKFCWRRVPGLTKKVPSDFFPASVTRCPTVGANCRSIDLRDQY